MPLIRITGLNPQAPTGELLAFQRRIQDMVLAIPELELKDPSQVTVSFVAELLPPVGTDVIVVVEGLFDSSRRTPVVRQRIADDIATVLSTFGRYAPYNVEIMILKAFDPADGYVKRSLK
jgi:hypothetical protein